jgi:hypothetical protein
LIFIKNQIKRSQPAATPTGDTFSTVDESNRLLGNAARQFGLTRHLPVTPHITLHFSAL